MTRFLKNLSNFQEVFWHKSDDWWKPWGTLVSHFFSSFHVPGLIIGTGDTKMSKAWPLLWRNQQFSRQLYKHINNSIIQHEVGERCMQSVDGVWKGSAWADGYGVYLMLLSLLWIFILSGWWLEYIYIYIYIYIYKINIWKYFNFGICFKNTHNSQTIFPAFELFKKYSLKTVYNP